MNPQSDTSTPRTGLSHRLAGWLPTRGNVVFTLLVAGLVITVGKVGALGVLQTGSPAVPRMVNYQGRLLTAGGSVVTDGDYRMRFDLYCEEGGGTSIWSEPRGGGTTGVRVSDGLFSVTLGALDSDNNPMPATFPCSPVFLGVIVNGEEMLPRERLTSVPYALQSEIADGSISTLKLGDGSVTTPKIADGAVTLGKLNQSLVDSLATGGLALVQVPPTLSGGNEVCAPGNEWRDLLTQQVVLEKPSTLRVSYQTLLWKILGNGRSFAAIRLNGTQNQDPGGTDMSQVGQTISSNWVANSDHVSSVQLFRDVPAGTHQVTLTIASADNGTSCARAYSISTEVFSR